MKTFDIKSGISRRIVVLLAGLTFLLSLIQILWAQNSSSYFEQQSSIIAIEAEHALGYGWIISPLSDASGDQAILFPQTDTLSFFSTQDTYVDRDAPNTPYGSLTQLVVDGKGGDKRGFFMTPWWDGKYEAFERAAFLKFEVSGLVDDIIEAKVFMYCVDAGIGGAIYELDPMIDNLNWTESEATWNYRPSTHYDANTIQYYLGSVNEGHWYAFDVTQALYGKSNGNYSFGIVMQDNKSTAWSSKEGTHPPYLWLRIKHSGLTISGKNCYYANDNPIENVKLELSGGFSQTLYSSAEGKYSFSDLLKNLSYTVQASKTANTDVGLFDITTYDAALTAQAAVGLHPLTENQRIAADVSCEGTVSMYDAALIAQYAVALPKSPSSHVAEWTFLPASYLYENLSSDQIAQNFTGILLGNVHGGWMQPNLTQGSGFVQKRYEKIPDIKATPGKLLQIPFLMPDEDEIISLDIDIQFDPQIMSFSNLKRTGLFKDATLVFNPQSDRLKIGIYSLKPIKKTSELFVLQFEVKQNGSNRGILSIDRLQLNDNILMTGKAQIFVSESSEVPTEFDLFQNYPNPFSPSSAVKYGNENGTRIKYHLPQPTEVNLNIYNCLGQKVRTLVSGKKDAGVYSVVWDGLNDNGELVSAGIYICRLTGAGKVKMKRVVMLH